MAANKKFENNTPLQFAVPSTVLSGAPLLLQGQMRSVRGNPRGVACVANEDYNSVTTRVSVDTNGAFDLTCLAESAESPVVNSAIAVGDALFANINTGTYDSTTGVWSGFTIDKNQSGARFGTALSTLAAGTSGTVTVRLGGAE